MDKSVFENARKGKGFSSPKPTGTKQESHSPVAPAVGEAQDHAIQFMGAAGANVAAQLQGKADFLQSLDHMLDQASAAIANAEQDILSGVRLERKLAERRSEYMQGVQADAAVSLEFEALTTLDALAKPTGFPSISESLKRIQPADKARLDASVLTSGKS